MKRVTARRQAAGRPAGPTRWFGPAVVAGNFADAWIWWVGPAIGASAAAALYYHGYLRGRDTT